MSDKQLQTNSLRARLNLVILAMVLFALAFAFFSGQTYLKLALNAERGELVDHLRINVDELIADLRKSSYDLAASIQQDHEFNAAIQNVATGHLSSILNEKFNEYPQISKQLKLEKLQLIDSGLNVLASATGGNSGHSVIQTNCPGIPANLARKPGEALLQPITVFCNFSGKPVFASIIAIGQMSDRYVLVVSDLAHSVLTLEAALGMPLSIDLADGTSIYQSANLPVVKHDAFSLMATHGLKDSSGRTALTISMHPDLTSFIAGLQYMRNFIMLMMSVLLIASVIYLRKMVASVLLDPLQSLSKQLRTSSLSGSELEGTESSDAGGDSREPWEMQQLYGALHDIAITDSLTGFANRAQFERELKQIFEGSRQTGAEHVLCYLDLDQFKVVNKASGHIGGDEFLRTVAELIRAAVRDTDIVSRMGGDEFGVLLKDCSITKAVEIANKLVESIKEHKFIWEEERFRLGACIGLVVINQENCELQTVMEYADTACYAAKEGGRNRIQIFQEKDEAVSRRQGEIQWVARINKAVEEDLFELLYQAVVPIVPKKDAKFCCELLLRMVEENGDPISPGAFMPAAERYGLMPALDRWVIRSVFTWLHVNPDAMNHFDVFFVNISSQSLGDESFLDYVKEQMVEHEISPGQVCFEVTETTAITDVGRVMEFAGEIKAMGFRISLDHFGTGVSSFCYLKTLPVDYLKIDGSFVKDMLDNLVDRAIVRSILDVGKAMGLETIAEHVENHNILMALQEIGVDYAQGYGILPPHKLSELGKGLSDNDSLVIEPENFSNPQKQNSA